MKTTIQTAIQTAPLHRCCMVTDGNVHRNDLCNGTLPDAPENLICEAMLPDIRTVAALIAAERHAFDRISPAVFTQEADFFAARILVLGVRRFHLDVRLTPMLDTANQRARAFASKHSLPFAPAEIRMSLHAKRPANLLIMETEHQMEAKGSLIANTLAFAANIPRLPL